MKLNYLVYVILKLNIALDSGKYQDVSMEEVREHIEAGDIVAWLNERVPAARLDGLCEAHLAELQAGLAFMQAEYGGMERKWGVINSGLCLLIAWTGEIIKERTRDWSGSLTHDEFYGKSGGSARAFLN